MRSKKEIFGNVNVKVTIHRYVPTNSVLYKYKLTNTNKYRAKLEANLKDFCWGSTV